MYYDMTSVLPQYFYEFFELLFAILCSRIEQWLNAYAVLKKFLKNQYQQNFHS